MNAGKRARQAGVCRAREAAGRGEQVDAARDRGHGEHAAGGDAAGAELVGVSVLVTEMVLAAVAYRAVEVSAGCYRLRLCSLDCEQCCTFSVKRVLAARVLVATSFAGAIEMVQGGHGSQATKGFEGG